jgi:hypothetical protein
MSDVQTHSFNAVCFMSSAQISVPGQAIQASRLVSPVFVFFAFSLALGGCASVPVVEPNGSLVRHYLGYVKVAVPQAAAQNAVYTSDVTVLGLRVGGGVGLGYSRDRQVVVPLDCRLAIFVATQAQLDDAITRLSDLVGKKGVCAVVDHSLETGEKP